MEEQVISFETAKLAQEKGFNLECRYFFNAGSRWKLQSDPIIRTGDDEFVEAPTQTLLQKWLRETHAIQAEVRTEPVYLKVPDYIPRIVIWTFNDIGHNRLSVSNLTDKTEKSYEAAFEIVLYEALKLIGGQPK